MKQLFYILLLAVALLNLGGYGLFIDRMEEQAGSDMEQQLDENKFDTSTLVSIKIPVTSLPYYTNTTTYQRQDGEFEMNGTVYNYVKARIYNDTLDMLCIPNPALTVLTWQKKEQAKQSYDYRTGQDKKSAPPARILKVFFQENLITKHVSGRGQASLGNPEKPNRQTLILPFYFIKAIDYPPET